MAATPDTVAVLNPDAYVAARPDGKIPSAEPSTWAEILRQSTTKKDEKIVFGYERVNYNPEISQPTVQALGETMSRQLIAILKTDQDIIATDSRYDRYRSFLSHVQQKYSEKNPGKDISDLQDNPSALDAFMELLMEDESNVLWATKIAEGELALLEAATQVYTRVDSQLEPTNFVGKQAILTESNKDEGFDRILEDRDLKPIKKGWRRFVPWTSATFEPANKTARAANERIKKIFTRESKKKTQSVVYVDFAQNAKLDMHVKIGGQEIDDVQASMLRNLELAGLVRHGEFLTPSAKNEIADIAIGIQEARTNVYAHLGFTLGEYNVTENNGTTVSPDINYMSNPDAPRIVTDGLDLPHREVYVGVGRMQIDRQIDILHDALNVKAKEFVEKKRPVSTLKAIAGHISRLESAEPVDKDRAVKIEKEEIPRFEELSKFFVDKNGKESEISDLIAQQDAINTRFGDTSDVEDWTVPVVSGTTRPKITYQEAYDRWNGAESAMQSQQVVNSIQNEITGFSTLITNKKNEISSLSEKTILNTRQTYLETVKNQVGENRYNKIKGWDQERKRYSEEVVDKKDQIRDLEVRIGSKLVKDATTIPPTYWTETDVKEQIEKLQLEMKSSGSQSSEVKRQLSAYKELQDRLQADNLKTIYDRGRQPASHPAVSEAIIEAKIAYPTYPRAYLYAIQVLYGEDITLPQNNEKFKTATQWFTPELFVQHLPRAGAARRGIDIHDAILDSPAGTEFINDKYMRRMMSFVMDEAHRGKLGQYSAVEKGALEMIEREPAADYDAEIEKRSTLITDTQETYRRAIPAFEGTILLGAAGVPPADRLRYFTFFKNIYSPLPPIVSAIPLEASRKEVFDHFKTSFATVDDALANKIVDSMYGLYNKGRVAEKVYADAIRGKSGPTAEANAYFLSAATQLITDYSQQKELMTMVESGKSFNEIARELSARTPPPSYYPHIDSIIFQLRYGIDPRRAVANAYSAQMRTVVGPIALTDPNVQIQLQNQSKLLDSVRSRETFRAQLDMVQKIYPSLSIDDMTLRIIKVLGKSHNDKDDIRECKMLATQLYNERKAVQRA